MSASSGCESDPTYGTLAPHIIAFDKDSAGLDPSRQKDRCRAAEHEDCRAGRAGEPHSAGLSAGADSDRRLPGRFYTVEARLRVGYDRALPADAVLIHEIDPTRDPPARLVNHLGDGDTRGAAGMWQPGDVFIDAAGGVAVAVESATATGFVVTINDRNPALAVDPRRLDDAAGRRRHLHLAAGSRGQWLRTPGRTSTTAARGRPVHPKREGCPIDDPPPSRRLSLAGARASGRRVDPPRACRDWLRRAALAAQ